ncbi:type VII secretion integral membrane protein EccD [Streptomyces olivaceoviridis]
MTTSPPMSSPAVPDLCRLSVEGLAGRADLAVPVTMPLAALLPVLLRQAGKPSGDEASWTLQRFGEQPLDLDGTPQTLGLRHGDVLYLRPEAEVLPPLVFDDVADGVAHVVEGRPGRWSPGATRWLSLAAACLTVAGAAAAVLLAAPSGTTAAGAGLAALVLGTAAVVARRAGADRAVVTTAGCGALVLGLFAGIVSTPAPGTTRLLLAAAWLLVLSGGLLALRTLPPLVPATALALAVATAAVCAVHAAGCSTAQATCLVAGALFVLGHLAPRVALRTARLRVPHLPHDAEQLQQDIEPETEEDVQRRTAVAVLLLDVLALTTAVICTAAWWLLSLDEGWTDRTLPLVFGAALLLRARALTGVVQRIATTLGGATAPLAVGLALGARHGTGAWAVELTALLVAAVLLLWTAQRLPGGRLLPVWGHAGDIAEWVCSIALLPLLLQLVHVYGHLRHLAS